VGAVATVVEAGDVLFETTGSVDAVDTVAVFVYGFEPVNGDETRNCVVIVADAPGASAPSAQGNVVVHAPEFATNERPAGAGSATETPVAVAGPLFTTVSVYVTTLPGATGPAGPVFVIATSASVPAPTTPVFAVAELFDGTGSGVAEETVAVFVIVVPAAPVACRTIVKTPDAPEAIDGIVHVTFGVVQAQPAAGVTDTKEVPAGTRSVSTAFAAPPGPLFVTVTVYVTFWPVTTAAGVPVFVTARSASDGAATGVETLEELFVGSGSAVVDVIAAVFPMSVPVSVPAGTATTSVNVSAAPAGKRARVQLTVPVEPTEGVEHVQVPGDTSDTNVVPEESGSVSATLVASLGPRLLATSVYVIVPPAATAVGVAVLTTFRSARGFAVTVAEPLAV
jgi:hypothetical protein